MNTKQDTYTITEYSEILYKLYYRDMITVADAVLRNQSDAEDVVQDALLTALKKHDKIPDPYSPKTKSFLLIVVRNRAIDLYRKNNRQETVSLDDINYEIPCESAPVIVEDTQDISSYLLRLSKRSRDILLLKYDNGFSTKEIAEMLSIKQDQYRKQLKEPSWR